MKPQGRIISATIIQVPSGKYYISLCCTDVEVKKLERTNKNVGIDLGIKDFAITSDETIIENPKYLQKFLNKLVILQRELYYLKRYQIKEKILCKSYQQC